MNVIVITIWNVRQLKLDFLELSGVLIMQLLFPSNYTLCSALFAVTKHFI